MTDFIEYPKWVDHPTKVDGQTIKGEPIPTRVLVQNAEEEAALLGKQKGKVPPKGWDN